MKTIQLPLSIITIDGQTQQRDIDTDRVDHYAQLMRDGTDFQEVEVIHDGKCYFLWDGFHRFFAAKKADVKMLKANVGKGTREDAEWLSFSANKTHGAPKTKDDDRSIIRKIVNSEAWKHKTQEQIAAHIGRSRKFVVGVFKEIGDEKTPIMSPGLQHRTEKVEKTQVTEKTEDTKKTEQSPPAKSDTKKEPKEALVADSVGNNIPANLRETFLDQGEIKAFLRQIDEFKTAVMDAVKAKPKLWHYFRANPFTTDIENIKRILKFAVPYAVCPTCKGKGPKECACKTAGFINSEMFKAMPKNDKAT